MQTAPLPHKPRQDLRQTAIRWFVRMQRADAEHPERSRFEAWLLAHPEHAKEYAAVTEVWDDFDSNTQLESLAVAMQQNLDQKNTLSAKKIKKSAAGFMGLVVMLVIGLLGYRQYTQPIMQLAANTPVGQMKQQLLEDGSKLTINANTDIEVLYYRHQRLVKLKRGEVIFEVEKDPGRPFVVDSGEAKITVLGTRFVVNRLNHLVRVSVDHGSVKVESQDANGNTTNPPIVLHNGEVAQVNTDSAPKRLSRPAVDAFSFADGVINFEQADLQEIAETLSRYRKPVIRTQQLTADSHITAVVKTADIEAFLSNLPDISPVLVKQGINETLILNNPSP